ncbi:MAG TPA: DNA methyltransferase [Solirubrobacteraceae bacterium]|jgi:adenine-specific DNA methylase|nr:DNA methyltransferase [Solirubrobacteraceae bacterium]
MNTNVKSVHNPPELSKPLGQLDAIYRHPLSASRTGPLYNAFSYPTKIAPETIALYIATHTDPGDTVLDVFAGSGTTGLAAKLCDKPTDAMLTQARQAGLNPVWGPRKVVLYELGVLGAFISQVMCNPPDPDRFATAANSLLENVSETHGWIYEAFDDNGHAGDIRHVIWSDTLVCPNCDGTLSYWDARVRFSPLRLADSFACPHCGVEVSPEDCERMMNRVYDPLLAEEVERKHRVPAMVYGITAGRRWRRAATDDDIQLAARVAGEPVSSAAPRRTVEWGDLHRSGYHRGITHMHHFYTPRNFLALDALWTAIDDQPDDLRDALRLLVLSFNASHATDMTRIVVKKGQTDFVLTGAQSGVLYISGLPVEKNVFKGVARKIGTLRDAFSLVSDSRSQIDVVNQSSTSLAIPDASIDYVFTDPPFGSYIPYAELSQLNEVWLGATTDRREEVIVSRGQEKSVDDYGELMTTVFSEVARVMKDDASMTLIFHSAHSSVWRALTDAIAQSGLHIKGASVLAKAQASFKQVVSSGSVKGDAAILLTKTESRPRRRDVRSRSVDEIVSKVVSAAVRSRHPDELSRERMFSRFVTTCLTEGVPVTVDAACFYDLKAVGEVLR